MSDTERSHSPEVASAITDSAYSSNGTTRTTVSQRESESVQSPESIVTDFENVSLNGSNGTRTRTNGSGTVDASKPDIFGYNIRSQAPPPKATLAYNNMELERRPSETLLSRGLGKKINVLTNYFKINHPAVIECYHYDLQFSCKKQPITKREEAKVIFWAFYEKHRSRFPPLTDFVYNDVNALFCKNKLNINGEYYEDLNMGRKTVTVVLKFVNYITVNDDPAMLTSFIGNLLTMRVRCPFNKESNYFTTYNRNVFYNSPHEIDSQLTVDLGAGIAAWTGLHGAVKPSCGLGTLYNVDIIHSIFYKQRIPLIQYYLEVLNGKTVTDEDWNQLQHYTLDLKQRHYLKEKLKGLKLYYNRGPNNMKSFKMNEFSREDADRTCFLIEGQRVSVREYWETKYGRLRYPRLPCIMLKNKSMIPFEAVFLSSDVNKFKGKAPARQQSTMIRNTAYNPEKRMEHILNLACKPGADGGYSQIAENDPYLRSFNVSIDTNFQELQASVLPVPKLLFQNTEFYDEHHKGEYKLTENGFRLPLNPKEIVAGLVFCDPDDRSSNEEVKDCVGNFGALMGILHKFKVTNVNGPHPEFVFKFDSGVVPQQFEKNCLEFKSQCAQNHPNKTPLLIIVMPYNCTSRKESNKSRQNEMSIYACIKRICDVNVGIHCQGVLHANMKKISNIQAATGHNLAMKIMAKIDVNLYKLERNGRHRNWTTFTNPEEPTLVLGVDVTHPGTQDLKTGNAIQRLSVAAIVGNIDTDCMRYGASYRVQSPGQERIVNMKEQFESRISAFVLATGKAPKHIVVLRDGVSETEFSKTLLEEKDAIEKAVEVLFTDKTACTITYIVVSKRHHTRFFATSDKDVNMEGMNLKPGTLVETGITSDNLFDFFLLSHPGPLGTSRPTHYYVLWDDWRPSPAFWQTIIHCLTYCYVRCPKAISLPAPVMYAHLAAKKAKDYLNDFLGQYRREIDNMSEYEQQVFVQKGIQTNQNITGMLFV